MIIHISSVYEYILSWIRVLVESKSSKGLLCVVTGGIDSILNAALLLRATSHIPVYIIFMGFKKDNEEKFEKWIIANNPIKHYKIIKPTHPVFNDKELENIDIASSISATYVDMYSKYYNCMTFGAISKSEYSMVKFFKSRIDEIYDYYPIIDLYKSECLALYKHMGLPEIDTKSITEEAFGYTYEELEWLDKENENLSIVSASNYPNLAPHWGLFNSRKKQLLLKVYHIEKDNRTKNINNNKKCLARKALPGSIS